MLFLWKNYLFPCIAEKPHIFHISEYNISLKLLSCMHEHNTGGTSAHENLTAICVASFMSKHSEVSIGEDSK